MMVLKKLKTEDNATKINAVLMESITKLKSTLGQTEN